MLSISKFNLNGYSYEIDPPFVYSLRYVNEMLIAECELDFQDLFYFESIYSQEPVYKLIEKIHCQINYDYESFVDCSIEELSGVAIKFRNNLQTRIRRTKINVVT